MVERLDDTQKVREFDPPLGHQHDAAASPEWVSVPFVRRIPIGKGGSNSRCGTNDSRRTATMGCFDTLVGTARCQDCGHEQGAELQTGMLGECMSWYRQWDEVIPGATMEFETHVLECQSCRHQFEVTPSLVMGFLCPFSEVPPKVYDTTALVEFLLQAARENCRAKHSEARTRNGLTCMMDVHVKELDGKQHLEFERNYPGQYGMPRVEEGMTSERVIRMMLDALKRGEVVLGGKQEECCSTGDG